MVVDIKKKYKLNWERLYSKKIQLFWSQPCKIGWSGGGVIVHIDETKFNFNVKNRRGMSVNACWAFVIVNTSLTPALGVCGVIPNRTASTLLSLIKSVVGGSVIHFWWMGTISRIE